MLRPWWSPLAAPVVGLADLVHRLHPAPGLGDRVAGLAAALGQAGAAEAASRRALARLAADPAALAAFLARGAARARGRPPVKRIDPERALAALADLMAAAEAAGLEPFLVFGTLLGAVRDGRFIRGDSDVDLAILGADALLALRRAVAEAGMAAGRVLRVRGRPSEFTMRHANGATIDVKTFTLEADGTTSWHTHSGRLVLVKRYPGHLRLARRAFQGVPIHVPDPPEAFLEWQYGPGWRTPDPGYHMLTSGPLHGAAHAAFCRAMGPRALLRRAYRGEGRKVLAMARGLARLFPDEPLWPALAASCEEALARLTPTA